MNITIRKIEELPTPVKKQPGRTEQKRYYDDKLKGFGIRVTSGGTKAFFVEKSVNGKLTRLTIGTYPAMSPQKARETALAELGKMASGIDPVAEKKAKRAKSVTLAEVFSAYKEARKSLKAKTLYNYERIMLTIFKSWLRKPITSITKDMVSRLHSRLGNESGHAQANGAMRVLRALFNFAIAEYEDSKGRSLIHENPVSRLSQTRAWYRVKRRQTFIKPHELNSWHKAVQELENTTFRDYFLLLLFTGLRRSEAAKLTWDDIDLKSRTLTISDTKNHETHTLPLSDYLIHLLSERKMTSTSKFVFPGPGINGYIHEPKKQIQKVVSNSGVHFTSHCLRRTFITIAESLDIPHYSLKKLLNHKTTSDVTSGYIVIDVERLRKPMQKITDYILNHVNENNNVTEINRQEIN